MSAFVLNKPYCLINAVDLSSHVTQISFTPTLDTPEDTSGGDTSRSYLPGLKNATGSITFNSDPTTGATIQTLWAAYGSVVAFEFRGSTAAVGTDNPKYTGNLLLTSFSLIDGSIGDTAKNSVSVQVSGNVTQATS